MIKRVTGAVLALAMGWCVLAAPRRRRPSSTSARRTRRSTIRTPTPSSGMGHPMFMMGDTLVALDWDLKSVHPLLAKSWTCRTTG